MKSSMTKEQLDAAITKTAKTLGTTKQEIANRLFAKDNWTWHMVMSASV